MIIRPDAETDWTELSRLYAAAFGQTAEADLVQNLRADGDLILSLTAIDDEPIGHIAFSPLILKETPALKACALAPLAVTPSHQRQGIGSQLVEEGLKRLREAGFDLVVVLGDPDYYRRFGFSPEQAATLKTPYDGPYLQARALTRQGHDAHGEAAYARAFAELT